MLLAMNLAKSRLVVVFSRRNLRLDLKVGASERGPIAPVLRLRERAKQR